MEDEKKKNADYSINILTFIVLAMMTFGETVLGVIATTNIIGVLLAIALFKAYVIVVNYMHIGSLFSDEEEAH